MKIPFLNNTYSKNLAEFFLRSEPVIKIIVRWVVLPKVRTRIEIFSIIDTFAKTSICQKVQKFVTFRHENRKKEQIDSCIFSLNSKTVRNFLHFGHLSKLKFIKIFYLSLFRKYWYEKVLIHSTCHHDS